MSDQLNPKLSDLPEPAMGFRWMFIPWIAVPWPDVDIHTESGSERIKLNNNFSFKGSTRFFPAYDTIEALRADYPDTDYCAQQVLMRKPPIESARFD